MAAREREPHGDQFAKIDAFGDARLQTSCLCPDRFGSEQRRGGAAGARGRVAARPSSGRARPGTASVARPSASVPTVPSSRFDSPRKRATKVSTGRS